MTNLCSAAVLACPFCGFIAVYLYTTGPRFPSNLPLLSCSIVIPVAHFLHLACSQRLEGVR